jgi:outer membrane protein assembly factor BamA
VFVRDVIRAFSGGASYPFSAFSRAELNLTGVLYKSEVLYRGYDLYSGEPVEKDEKLTGLGYVQPEVALVFDNSYFGWTGPVGGRRWRAQFSHTYGDINFAEALLDFRNYWNYRQKLVLAGRLVGLSRFGVEADRFGLFWGGPYYLRGYDYYSFEPDSRECTASRYFGPTESLSRCPVRDQLVGSSAILLNTELRYPVIKELQIGFLGNFPPVDAVLFFDGGVAWDNAICTQADPTRSSGCAADGGQDVRLVWDRKAGQDPYVYREPLFSWGFGLRMNVFYTVLRMDYAFPINRADRGGVFSLSFGPSF